MVGDGSPAYGIAMYTFVKKLQYVKFHLKKWNRTSFGYFKVMKKRAQASLDVITRQIQDCGFLDALGQVEV